MHRTTTTTSGHADQPHAVNPGRWRALGVLAVAQFMLILDITVVTVALPEIGGDLELSRAAVPWVITAYTLFFGGLMLFGGRAADLFGARRIATIGLTVFTVASLASGLATDATLLLGGRVGQGIGAALLSPAALSLITTTFTGAERNKALGVWGALGGTGAAFGVLVGGLLTAGPGWAWVFYVNVPIGVALLVAMHRVVPAGPRPQRRRIDLPGALAVTAATGSAIYGLINAGDGGWADTGTLVPLAAAGVLYGVFFAIERTVAEPLVRPDVLKRRPVVAAAFLMLVATGLLIGAFFLGSFYLQNVRHEGALATGLLFLPIAIGTIAGAHGAGHAIAHAGYRAVAATGLAIAAGGLAAPAVWTGTVALIAGVSVAAAGIGSVFVAASTTALTTVNHAEAGITSGIVNTFHELGSAVGVAVISSVAATSIASGGSDSSGFTAAFTFSAATAAVAALVALAVVPTGKPAPGTRVSAH